MKIAIIGAGFYGLHLADSLKQLGIDIKVFEGEDDILKKASGNNQYRLHLGFHYARNFRTREQSRLGFHEFLKKYSFLTQKKLKKITI